MNMGFVDQNITKSALFCEKIQNKLYKCTTQTQWRFALDLETSGDNKCTCLPKLYGDPVRNKSKQCYQCGNDLMQISIYDHHTRKLFTKYYRPRNKVTQKALELHDICENTLTKNNASEFTWNDAHEIKKILGLKPICLAHGLDADWNVLMAQFQKVSYNQRNYNYHQDSICTVKIAQSYCLPKSLKDLCQLYFVYNNKPHNAVSDMTAVINVYLRMQTLL